MRTSVSAEAYGDWNKKKEHALIGDVTVQLNVGTGRMKVEVPSRSVSSLRPFVHFRYTVTAQMHYEQVEWVRVSAAAAPAEPEEDDDDKD